MNGELAQCFALAAHGSHWLRDRGLQPDLEGANSAFQFVERVDFDGEPGVGPWLDSLARQGAERIWLAAPGPWLPGPQGRLPTHHAAAFANGVSSGLLVSTADGNQLWRAGWEVGDQQAPDRRIWRVAYSSTPVPFGPEKVMFQPDDAGQWLTAALERAAAFARDAGVDHWPDVFDKALGLWTADDPAPPYHPDLFPAGLAEPTAARLAAMAAAAWVFGGMGSWNDLGFEEPDQQAEYDRISAHLFAMVVAATLAAANAPLRD